MSLGKLLVKLGGTTYQAIEQAANEDSNALPVGSVFFKPYTSSPNVFFRTASIVSAPLLLVGLSAFFALNAIYSLLKTIANLVTLDLESAADNIRESGYGALGCLIAGIAAIASPFINFIDSVGGIVTTIMSVSQQQGESEELQLSLN